MKKILIVDSTDIIKDMIKDSLLQAGRYRIIGSRNWEKAFKLYEKKSPDLVMMDIAIDIRDGVKAARKILKMNPIAKLIVIIAIGQEDFLKECVSMGVTDYIVRPFTKERLLFAIKKIW